MGRLLRGSLAQLPKRFLKAERVKGNAGVLVSVHCHSTHKPLLWRYGQAWASVVGQIIRCQRPRRLAHSRVRGDTSRLPLRRFTLQVQLQQTDEHLRVVHLIRPAVGLKDGSVEGGVRVGEPGGALVVEIGQRALLQLGL